MKFIYHLTPRELFRIYLRYHYLSNKSAYFILIGMEVLIIHHTQKFTPSVLIILSMPFIHFLGSIWDTYSFVKKRVVPASSGNYTLEITDERILLTDSDGNFSSYHLDFVIGIQKKKQVYVLLFKNLYQVYFPLHMFESKQEEERFFELINQKKGVARKTGPQDILDS